MNAAVWLERLGLRDRRRPTRRSVRSRTARRPVRSRTARRPVRSRTARRLLVALLAVLALLGGIWMWLRDSSLVAVRHVRVTGAQGPDAGQIRSALTAAARGMTTLNVNIKQLKTAVTPYPVVKSLSVSTQFPHGMRIRVIEQIPVAAVMFGGRAVAVAADGTLLHDGVQQAPLPVISLQSLPGGSRLTDPTALSELALLADAPQPLLKKVGQASVDAAHGLVAQLRDGPSIYFGARTRLVAKWIAATEVLADSRSTGASYIDVTDPERPAAGASPGAATTSSGGG